MTTKEVSECICPEDMKKIPQSKVLDFQAIRNNVMVVVARYNKDCPVHGYTVNEEEKKEND